MSVSLGEGGEGGGEGGGTCGAAVLKVRGARVQDRERCEVFDEAD